MALCRAPGTNRAMKRVPVMLPYPFPGPFDYRVPPDLDPQPGDIVLVPLNRREEIGVVWDAPPDQRAGTQAEADRRHPRRPADAPCAAPVRRLGGRLHPGAARRGHGDGAADRTPAHGPPPSAGYRRADPLPTEARITEARQRILDAWQTREPRTAADLARVAGPAPGGARHGRCRTAAARRCQ